MLSRLRHFDIAKGIGILLVIMGHCIPDASTPTGVSEPHFAIFFRVIYSFHMPLFFFISGFLTPPLFEAKEKSALIVKRINRLLVPYFFVGICYLPFKLVLSSFANAPYDVGNLWKIFLGVNPDGELWFLYAMFIISAALAIFGNRVNRAGIFLALALAVIDLRTNFLPVKIFWFALFYVLGIYMRRYHQKFLQRINFGGAAVILAVFVAGNLAGEAFSAAIAGVMLCLWISWKLSAKNFAAVRWLEFLGIFSMDLYILSDIVKIPFRIVFWQWLHLYGLAFVVCTVCSVGISLILSKYFIRRNELARRLILGMR